MIYCFIYLFIFSTKTSNNYLYQKHIQEHLQSYTNLKMSEFWSNSPEFKKFYTFSLLTPDHIDNIWQILV